MSRLRGPLAHRNFRLLVGCDVTSLLGSAMSTVALPFAVLHSGGTLSDIGYVSAAGLVPTVVFLLWGGVLADRLPRQQVMMVANAASGAIQAIFGVLVLSGHAQLWEMLLLAALRGCAVGFYQPASQGLMPQTVSADQLASANAVRRLGQNGALIAGSGLGGLLVAAVGPGWGLIADAASYLLAAALRTGMRFDRLPPVEHSDTLQELRDGWHAFTSRRWLWAIVSQFGLVNAAFVGILFVIGPVVAQNHLGGAGSWGLILAADSIGALAGGIVMVRYRPRRLLLSASLGVPMLALPLLALGTTTVVPIIALAALCAGVGIEVFEVNWSTAMQQQIPADMLSRASAYDALGSYALTPIGTVIAGPLAAAVGAAAVLIGGGVVIVLSSVAVLCVGDVRHLQRGVPLEDGEGAASDLVRV